MSAIPPSSLGEESKSKSKSNTPRSASLKTSNVELLARLLPSDEPVSKGLNGVDRSDRSHRSLGRKRTQEKLVVVNKSSLLGCFKASGARKAVREAEGTEMSASKPKDGAPVSQRPILSVKRLDLTAAAKDVKAALDKDYARSFGAKSKDYASRNWVEFLITLVSAYPMFIVYFLSNLQGKNALISAPLQQTAGVVGSVVNTGFTGPQLTATAEAVVKKTSEMRQYGSTVFAESWAEAAFLILGLVAFTLSGLAASLSYATSTEDGEEIEHWNHKAVQIGMNLGIILNVLLMLKAAYSLVQLAASKICPRRDQDQLEYESAKADFDERIEKAGLKHNPDDIRGVLEDFSRLSFDDREAFKTSVKAHEAVVARGADDSSLKKCGSGTIKTVLGVTSVALYFATIPNVISAVKNPGAMDALRYFYRKVGATNFGGAAALNLSNLAFSVYYAHPGFMTIARMLARVFKNYDKTPVKSGIALIVGAGLVFYSAGTSLTQALDGSGGFPWENPASVQKLLAISSAVNALFINFTALMPMYNLTYDLLNLMELAGRSLCKPLCKTVCHRPDSTALTRADVMVVPCEVDHFESQRVRLAMLESSRNLLSAAGARDPAEFDKALQAPMFKAMLSAAAAAGTGATAPHASATTATDSPDKAAGGLGSRRSSSSRRVPLLAELDALDA
jgi:hypothetical protein